MKAYIKKKVSDYSKSANFSKEEWIEYTDSIANNLGWFIITFNMIEDSIIELLVDLFLFKLDVPEENIYAFLCEMSFSQRVKALDTQVGIFAEDCENKDEIIDCLKTIIKELEDLTTIRNNYVHANWFDYEKIDQKRIIKIKTRADRKGIYNYYLEIDPDEIEQNEDRIEAIDEMIVDLEKKLEINLHRP
ncbi:hypothetical protein ACFLTE_08990 [Bacteroidota bacterium]